MAQEGDKKISELPSAGFNSSSQFVADDVDQNEESGYATKSHLLSEVGNKTMNSFAYTQSSLQTTSKVPVGAVNEIHNTVGGKILVGILEAGDTSITFTDAVITTNMSYDYYTDGNLVPTSVTISSGSAVFTFDAQENDIVVKVVIF